MKTGANLASIGTLDYGRMRSHIHKKDDIFLQSRLLFGEFLGDNIQKLGLVVVGDTIVAV